MKPGMAEMFKALAEEAMDSRFTGVDRVCALMEHAYQLGTLHAQSTPPEELISKWIPIDKAPLAVWGLGWSPGWRRPFPAMCNGEDGAVWVDTCEVSAQGWQTFATHWMPMPEAPVSPQLIPTEKT